MSAPTPLEALGQVLAEVSAASRQQTQVLRVLMNRAEAAGGMSSMKRMVEGEDPQAFLDVFEATATSCKWPEEEWGAKLLPLLVGEAQRAALSLPATARMQYADLRHAILDRVGSSPEDHRRKFRAMKLGSEDRPFVLAYRMRDAATRWLQPNGLDPKMLESIILEQFIDALPARTSAWVRYHSSPDVKTAVKLAEEHLAVQREATPKTAERPTPAPRRRHAPTYTQQGGGHGAIISPLLVHFRVPALRRGGFPRRWRLKHQGRCAGGADGSVTCAGSAP
nr:zinc finger protein with KRAB and SCAN domains 3-like [Nerophis lumbriciformis]